MAINVPLPPDLEQFVHEQLATGQFQSEEEIIYAALHLLEDQTHGGPRRQDGQKLPAAPPPAASWEELRAQLTHPSTHTAGPSTPARRSPRGILADLRSNVSLEDFWEARRDMWACLPRGSA